MRKVLCEKNHYYDADRYDTCPHCARARAFSEKMGQPQTSAPRENRAPAIYWSVEQLRGRESVTPEQHAAQSEELDMRTMALLEPVETAFAAPQTRTVLRKSEAVAEMPVEPLQEPEVPAEVPEVPIEEPVELPEEPKVPAKVPEVPVEESAELLEEPEVPAEKPEIPIEVPKAPVNAPAELPEESETPIEKPKEAPQESEAPTEEPVAPAMPPVLPFDRTVGWLVCMKGARAGESFSLLCGRNLIGAGAQVDVRLDFDPEVTQGAQCVLTFDPESEAYYIQCGESRGLSYRNGALLLVPERLDAYDTIRLGKTTLVFVPLITDSFRWQDYLGGAQ